TGLHALLERDALFVTSVVNRWCAFEIVWHLLHGDLRVALRRVGGTWTGASLDGDDGEVQVSARCYTPRSLAQLLGPFFRLEQVLGLGVFVPPPYLSQLAGAHPGPFRALESLEGWCADAFPFSWSGDHFTAIFRRCDV
ncbi:MAG: hypothetical protein CL878_12505, partial [Dehalococcoidia bacterium]|nr:hypothetical protein [Dehalococcoidia bacterium]